MYNRHDTAARPAPADKLEGLDLLVTDKRGRQQRLSVASGWPEPAVATTPTVPDREAPPSDPAPPAAEPAAPDIHHIAIHMGSVMARPKVVETELETAFADGSKAVDDAAASDGGLDAQTAPGLLNDTAAAAADAAHSHPVAGDGNTPSDPPKPT
ncbi:MAG: hypothetical protein LH480_10110 [Rubrivivax sp.]|nr:hypothetical protein [Rubrivivax sp.]